MDRRRFATRAIGHEDWPAGDVVPPIHLSSTFDVGVPEADRDEEEYVYGRIDNPTRRALEERLADLSGGARGFAFASGTAAIATTILSVVSPGDHLVAVEDCYAGTRGLLERLVRDRLDVEVEFVDPTDPAAVAGAVRPETALVWLETPTNPLLRVCDVAAIADRVGDRAVVAVDNTFLSPYFQRPLELGADLVVHSTTKYLNGHSDSIGGAVVADREDGTVELLEFLQRSGVGAVLSPFDSYLVGRGLSTLPVRMRAHEANATAVAEYLADHELVERVRYTGLASHPQHDLAADQAEGHGGVVSFELDGGRDDAAAFLEALETFTVAVSLGGVESLIEHPASMTHEPLGADTRAELGISDGLVRASVGIEDVEDLIADLDRGFAALRGR